jgi:hypothetical protein
MWEGHQYSSSFPQFTNAYQRKIDTITIADVVITTIVIGH